MTSRSERDLQPRVDAPHVVYNDGRVSRRQCPVCLQERTPSIVHNARDVDPPAGTTGPSGFEPAPYWDEDGIFVHPRVIYQTFVCSNGHRWTELWQNGQLVGVRKP